MHLVRKWPLLSEDVSELHSRAAVTDFLGHLFGMFTWRCFIMCRN